MFSEDKKVLQAYMCHEYGTQLCKLCFIYSSLKLSPNLIPVVLIFVLGTIAYA